MTSKWATLVGIFVATYSYGVTTQPSQPQDWRVFDSCLSRTAGALPRTSSPGAELQPSQAEFDFCGEASGAPQGIDAILRCVNELAATAGGRNADQSLLLLSCSLAPHAQTPRIDQCLDGLKQNTGNDLMAVDFFACRTGQRANEILACRRQIGRDLNRYFTRGQGLIVLTRGNSSTSVRRQFSEGALSNLASRACSSGKSAPSIMNCLNHPTLVRSLNERVPAGNILVTANLMVEACSSERNSNELGHCVSNARQELRRMDSSLPFFSSFALQACSGTRASDDVMNCTSTVRGRHPQFFLADVLSMCRGPRFITATEAIARLQSPSGETTASSTQQSDAPRAKTIAPASAESPSESLGTSTAVTPAKD